MTAAMFPDHGPLTVSLLTLSVEEMVTQAVLAHGVGCATPPEVLVRDAAHGLVLQLRQKFAAERLETVRCEWPATWWDHFKTRFFPHWALRRWPARFEFRELRSDAAYPEIAIPRGQRRVILTHINMPPPHWRTA